MKTLILTLLLCSQVSYAGGSQVGTLGDNSSGNMKNNQKKINSTHGGAPLANSSVGNFGHGSKFFGGSQGGTLGNGQGNMGGSVGTIEVAGNGFGTMGERLVGTSVHSYFGGTGGGGILAMHSNGTDNSRVGSL